MILAIAFRIGSDISHCSVLDLTFIPLLINMLGCFWGRSCFFV